MPRPPGGQNARAATVLGWCSPQSSVPRQTVGHHARAATDEMGLKRPAKAAVERCPGRPGHPPHRSWLFACSSSYTHRPGRSGAHGPAGFWASFPIPQNPFVWVSLKMDSRPHNRATGSHEAGGDGCNGRSRLPGAAEDLFPHTGPGRRTAFLLALPSYTHRPGRSGAHGPAGFWACLPIPQNSLVWVSLKMDSRPHNRTTGSHEAPPLAPAPDSPPPNRPTPYPNPPTLYPSRPTLYRPTLYRPTLEITCPREVPPQPTYPIPPQANLLSALVDLP